MKNKLFEKVCKKIISAPLFWILALCFSIMSIEYDYVPTKLISKESQFVAILTLNVAMLIMPISYALVRRIWREYKKRRYLRSFNGYLKYFVKEDNPKQVNKEAVISFIFLMLPIWLYIKDILVIKSIVSGYITVFFIINSQFALILYSMQANLSEYIKVLLNEKKITRFKDYNDEISQIVRLTRISTILNNGFLIAYFSFVVVISQIIPWTFKVEDITTLVIYVIMLTYFLSDSTTNSKAINKNLLELRKKIKEFSTRTDEENEQIEKEETEKEQKAKKEKVKDEKTKKKQKTAEDEYNELLENYIRNRRR